MTCLSCPCCSHPNVNITFTMQTTQRFLHLPHVFRAKEKSLLHLLYVTGIPQANLSAAHKLCLTLKY